MAKGVLEVAHIFGLVIQERGAKKQGKEAKTRSDVLVKGGEGYGYR